MEEKDENKGKWGSSGNAENKQTDKYKADEKNKPTNKEQQTVPSPAKLGENEAYEPGIGTYSLTEHDLKYSFGQQPDKPDAEKAPDKTNKTGSWSGNKNKAD